MKALALSFLFISSLFFSASSAFAASAADHIVEVGSYKAVDVESGQLEASLVLRADQTVSFGLKTVDGIELACDGTYAVAGELFIADMKCPMEGLEQIQVKIDITTVTPESVRSEKGALVGVTLEMIGPDAFQFYLKLVE